MCNQKPKDCYLKKWSGCVRDDECGDFKDGFCSYFTPPPHLVKISSRKLRHALSFSLECTNVCSVKKDTKHSSVLLLRLVSFFTEETLISKM